MDLKKSLQTILGILLGLAPVILIVGFVNPFFASKAHNRLPAYDEPVAKVFCAEGSCWRRPHGSSSLQKLVSPSVYLASEGDELIVLEQGSRLEVSFIHRTQRLVLADMAVVRLTADMIDGTEVDSATEKGAWSGAWIPEAIEGFAAKAPEKNVSGQPKEVEKKTEPPPAGPENETPEKAAAAADKAGSPDAPDKFVPQVKLLSMGALNFEMRSPMNFQAYLALRFPLRVDFILFHRLDRAVVQDSKELPEALRSQSWTLVEIKSDDSVVAIRSFNPDRIEVPEGISFGADLMIDRIGTYGLLPAGQALGRAVEVPVRFTVYDRSEFKSRLRNDLKHIKKNSVQRLRVEP
jgi:hypothetical protein